MLSTNTHSHVTHTHTNTLDTHINFYICSPQQLPPPSRSSPHILLPISFHFNFSLPLPSSPLLPLLSLPPLLPSLQSQTNFVVVCLILLLSKLPLPNALADSLSLSCCRIAYTTCCTRRTILFFSNALIPFLFRLCVCVCWCVLCVFCVVWHVLLVSGYDEFIPFCCHYRNCCSLFSCCSSTSSLSVAVAVYFTQKPNRLFGTLL